MKKTLFCIISFVLFFYPIYSIEDAEPEEFDRLLMSVFTNFADTFDSRSKIVYMKNNRPLLKNEIKNGQIHCIKKNPMGEKFNKYGILNFKNGVIEDGKYIWFYDDYNSRKIAILENYKDGELNGEVKWYNAKGELIRMDIMVDGVNRSKWIKCEFGNGVIEQEERDFGKYTVLKIVDRKGKLSCYQMRRGDKFISKFYYRTGRLKTKSVYKTVRGDIKKMELDRDVLVDEKKYPDVWWNIFR